jgi:hypothetical protein
VANVTFVIGNILHVMGKRHFSEHGSHHLPHMQDVQWNLCYNLLIISYGFVDGPLAIAHERTKIYCCLKGRGSVTIQINDEPW